MFINSNLTEFWPFSQWFSGQHITPLLPAWLKNRGQSGPKVDELILALDPGSWSQRLEHRSETLQAILVDALC